MTTLLALPSRAVRRVEKLAAEAGRTPEEMLQFVIRDGLDYCEYVVRRTNEGLVDLENGRSMTAVEARAHFDKRRAQRRAPKAA